MKRALTAIIILTLSFGSCYQQEDFIVTGMEPLYFAFDDFTNVQTESPKELGQLGDIVVVGDFLFIVELFRGIHVINNSNPQLPVTEYFWRVDGCTTFTIDGNTLFAGNGKHLIVIDITNKDEISYVKHISDFYNGNELIGFSRPEENYRGFFICPNREEGIIYDWKSAELLNPLCEAY